MAQKYCTVCGKPVSDQDKVCPNCGAWNLTQKTNDDTINTVKDNDVSLKRILLPLLALIAIVVFVANVPISKYGIGANAISPDSVAQTSLDEADETVADEPAAEDEEQTGVEENQQTEEEEAQPTEETPQKGMLSANYPSVSGTYKGEIKTPAVIRLHQLGGRIFGTIRYTKFDSPALNISGTIEEDGSFELTELDENNKESGRITGTITDGIMSGKFYNPQKDTSTDFKLSKEQTSTEKSGAEDQPQTEEKTLNTPSVSGTYKGEIKTPTVIRLKQEKNRIFGTIRYTKFDSPALDISGTVEPDGSFELKEYGENRELSGRITGTIKGNTMSGNFYNTQKDTNTRFELKRE